MASLIHDQISAEELLRLVHQYPQLLETAIATLRRRVHNQTGFGAPLDLNDTSGLLDLIDKRDSDSGSDVDEDTPLTGDADLPAADVAPLHLTR